MGRVMTCLPEEAPECASIPVGSYLDENRTGLHEGCVGLSGSVRCDDEVRLPHADDLLLEAHALELKSPFKGCFIQNGLEHIPGGVEDL